jgi:hypothetical protein
MDHKYIHDTYPEQKETCEQHKVSPVPPYPDQMIVVSDGVLEGDPVEGVRYPSPDHMSGWWLTTSKYNGNSDSLKTEHAYHVYEKRPDLIKFLALPHGYRFMENKEKHDIWFDEKAAVQKP